MKTFSVDVTEDVAKLIEKVLETELEQEFEKAIADFNKRKREIIARVLIKVSKEVDIQTLGERTTFTIRELK